MEMSGSGAGEDGARVERERVTAILESIGDAFYAVDAGFRFTYVNRRAEAWWGRSRAELLGRHYWTEFPQAVGSESQRMHLLAMAERRQLRFEAVSPIIGRWVDVTLYPDADGGLSCYFRDIDERKAAEQALRDSEERYRILAELSPDATWLNQDGRIVYANPAAARLLGTTVDELLGISPFDLVEPEFHAGLRERVARLVEHRDATSPLAEMRWRRRDGSVIDVESAAGVVPWQGRPAIQVVFRDVTRRKHADHEREQLLRELEVERARLLDVFRQAPSFLAVLRGPDHVFELVNDAYHQLVGHRDVVGKPLFEALPEVRGQGFEQLVQRVYEHGEPYTARELPVVLRRAPGAPLEERFVDVVYMPLVESDGRRAGIIAHGTDVTAQVRARREVERMLAESEAARAAANAARERSEAVLASIADAFYLLDRDWRFTYVNDPAEVLLQTTRAALVGRTLWEAFPGVTGSPFEGPYREAMATGRVTSAEAYFPPLGTWFDVRTYPWTGGLMVHFRDIGERKAAEAERERLLADAEAARGEAEHANRAKSEFLAVMSHELRTPLNAIGGYAELMEMGIRGPITEMQREDLRRVQASQRHLLGLINEVLNYARLETGTVHYDLEDVLVASALASADSLVAPQARAKSLALVVREAPPRLAVRADAEKLRQILVNLLSNAIKFTEPRDGRPGRIELSCTTDGARVLLQVRDTGIGIPADKLEAIFDPFVQVRADLTRTAEGTGLGLAISRDLARGMGGDLTVESTPGVGSTFTVALPRAE